MTERPPRFVIGTLASLGTGGAPLPRLKDRRFVTVTRASVPVFKHHVSSRGAALEEATWTGLEYLVDSVADDPSVKVKVLDVSAREMVRDFQRAPELNQCALYKKAYEEALGTFGGEPFGCLVADYAFTLRSPEQLELLERLSQLAAACWSPLLLELDPDVPDALQQWTLFRKSAAAAFLFPLAPTAEVQSPGAIGCNPAYRIAATARHALDPLLNAILPVQSGAKGPPVSLAQLLFLGGLTAQFRHRLRIRGKSRAPDVTYLSETKFSWDAKSARSWRGA